MPKTFAIHPGDILLTEFMEQLGLTPTAKSSASVANIVILNGVKGLLLSLPLVCHSQKGIWVGGWQDLKGKV